MLLRSVSHRDKNLILLRSRTRCLLVLVTLCPMPISDEQYVSITTFRKSGERVSSPVWIAPLPDGTAGFVTDLDSGKVKRIRNHPQVILRPCSARGKVADNAVEVIATATYVTGDEYAAVRTAINAKYGMLAQLMSIPSRINKLIGRESEKTGAVVLTFE